MHGDFDEEMRSCFCCEDGVLMRAPLYLEQTRVEQIWADEMFCNGKDPG